MMTIAMALRRIKKLKGQVSEITNRAYQSVHWLDKKEPDFRFSRLIEQQEAKITEMIELEAAVAAANATNTIKFKDKDITISKAIRWLQETKGAISFYGSLQIREGEEERPTMEWDDTLERNVRRKEIIIHKSAISGVDRVKKIEELRDFFEELNNLVETANHRVEITYEEPEGNS